MTVVKLTKRERRLARRQTGGSVVETYQQTPKNVLGGIQLSHFAPLTKNQNRAVDMWENGLNLTLHGVAGTGKTYLGLALGLQTVFESDGDMKLVICRSIVPTRDIGFLPGTEKEKIAVYESVYRDSFSKLTTRNDGYDYLKRAGIVDFIPTSFIRGKTLDNCVIVVDEINNLTFHELDSVITRLGENSRIIFSGDFRQSDLKGERDRGGLKTFMQILQRMPEFGTVDFEIEDIVRSSLVKSYIVTKTKMDIS